VCVVGTDSGIYKVLFLLHMLAVIGGIGTVVLNGVYAAKAKAAGGVGGTAVSVANYEVSDVAGKLIYLIPVFGILMVLVSDDAIEFSDTWIWLSMLLYVVALGISHALLIPGHRRYNALAAGEGGPSIGVEAQGLEKKMAGAGATLDIIIVILVALMIWKPGA
jgi:hypothetical protein